MTDQPENQGKNNAYHDACGYGKINLPFFAFYMNISRKAPQEGNMPHGEENQPQNNQADPRNNEYSAQL